MDIWSAIIMLAISYLVTNAMTPKSNTQSQKPAAFEEFEFPQSEEGSPQCVVFGEVWSSDWMVLDVGNYRSTAITKTT